MAKSGPWRKCNDTQVHPMTASDLFNGQVNPSLLFYRNIAQPAARCDSKPEALELLKSWVQEDTFEKEKEKAEAQADREAKKKQQRLRDEARPMSTRLKRQKMEPPSLPILYVSVSAVEPGKDTGKGLFIRHQVTCWVAVCAIRACLELREFAQAGKGEVMCLVCDPKLLLASKSITLVENQIRSLADENGSTKQKDDRRKE